MALWLACTIALSTLYAYVRNNDSKLSGLPQEAYTLTPERWDADAVKTTAASFSEPPHVWLAEKLPPRTGRRYVVVGGAGFLGGWIILHLVARGEDPRRIRCLDIALPTRDDLRQGAAADVDYIQVDITDASALEAAFCKSWPASSIPGSSELTVFDTAASFRYHERHPALLPLSERLNVHGTQNVVDAARRAGASVFIYTSSGTLVMRPTRLWLWPWEKEPAHVVQVISEDTGAPHKFYSHYAATKWAAERIVSGADKTPSGDSVLRTGAIRPATIYGPTAQLKIGQYVVQKTNPTWSGNIASSFVHVENCSLAHLLYEQCLIEAPRETHRPDLGGRAFCVADSGPTPTFGDVYSAVNILTNGEAVFSYVSPSLLLALAHILEWYHLARYCFTRGPLATLQGLLPPLSNDLAMLQPSTFMLATTHLIFDDSRARLPANKGGLGYTACTSMEGICRVVLEHQQRAGKQTTDLD